MPLIEPGSISPFLEAQTFTCREDAKASETSTALKQEFFTDLYFVHTSLGVCVSVPML